MQHLQESVEKVEKQILHEQTRQELKGLITEMKKIGIEKLPYSYSALKRFIDPETMNVHYNKHYKGYVDKLNKLLVKRKGDKDLEKIIRNISRYPKAIRDNAGGAFNHALFWNMLTPEQMEVGPELMKKIKKDFGTFAKFKKQFEDVARLRFGSGWVWLVLTNKGTLKIMSTPNQDNPLMNIIEGGGYPLLGLDLWEHAYYLKYKNKRDEYIKNFWTAVNWSFVENMYSMKTETSLLESVQLGNLLKEYKSESCSRAETEVYRMLFNVNKQARNIYKNTINKVLNETFPEKYHTKTEGGEIPGIYNLEKPGRSVINYMNTNYSVFCIMVRDLNKVITTSLNEPSLDFTDKTPLEQVKEVKRMCNYIEKFRDRIFNTDSNTFKNIMNTLKEKDSIGTRRETSAKMVIENNIPNVKVTATAGAGKEKDAYQKIDMEIFIDSKKHTAQVKGFDELVPEGEKLTVTKTGEVEKYGVDWMVFVKGKHVVIFKNNPNIVLGQYVFDKEDLLYNFGT
jgi:Fe-Mn family superoxide dismutase